MRKKKKIILQIFTALLLLILSAFLYLLIYDNTKKNQKNKVNYQLSNKEYKLMQNGDIILRRGYGIVSDMIVNTLAEDISLSHCGIIIKNDTTFSVIHSVSQSISDYDGVQIQDIRRFIHDSKENSVVVVRYSNSNDTSSNNTIAERAAHYLSKKAPFDMAFNIEDTTAFFCTELIWKVILDAKKTDIFVNKYGLNKREFLKFDVFFNEDFFETVFSHH